MKSKNTVKMFEVFLLSLLFVPSVAITYAFGTSVDEDEAIAVADVWYAMELNSACAKIDKTESAARLNKLQNRQVFYLISKNGLVDSRPKKGEVLAFVVTYEPTGFVVVSGEDRIEPIVVFSVESEFRWDQPERNFLRDFLGKTMTERWEDLKTKTARGVMVDVHPNWLYLRSKLQKNIILQEVTHDAPAGTVYILWDTAAWDQCSFYNETVAANNGGDICIPTGCTATAMAIKMRFHEWPANGNSSRAYTDNDGDVQFNHSVNFGAQSYNWSAMPTDTSVATNPNAHVADLMYHCGVAVDMNYEVGCCGVGTGSGAWPTASSMNTYFRYKGTIDRASSHEGPMEESIRGGIPVVLCSTKHTLVADGYRDTQSPYFHLNCGWGNSNCGWYNLNQIPGGDLMIHTSCPYCQPNNYIYVDSTWAGPENGNIQNPYNTISEGVSSVPVGGHLWLKEGYYSAITINKAMTIRSYKGTATIGQ